MCKHGCSFTHPWRVVALPTLTDGQSTCLGFRSPLRRIYTHSSQDRQEKAL